MKAFFVGLRFQLLFVLDYQIPTYKVFGFFNKYTDNLEAASYIDDTSEEV